MTKIDRSDKIQLLYPDPDRTTLSPDESDKLDSVSWYTTTVKRDMGARRVTERIPGSKHKHCVYFVKRMSPNPMTSEEER
jgi:hypothetical protein